MSPEEICALIVGWLAAIFGWVKWLYEIKEKRRERAAKEKAESELKEIRRRSNAPYLRPNDSRLNGLYWDRGQPGRISFVTPLHGNLLCQLRNEVDLKPEDEQIVLFVVDNIGESARSVTLKLDNETISMQREADMQNAHGFYFLVYPYKKAKHGAEQRLALSFESATGVQDTHIYKTRHGIRLLQRTDPPLP
jgi:hypothetical protein